MRNIDIQNLIVKKTNKIASNDFRLNYIFTNGTNKY